MSNPEEQRFHLVFAGQLLPGTEREAAQQTLAEFFAVADAAAVAVFFSGRPIPLRRNLEKQEAVRMYRRLRTAGLICDVQPVSGVPAADARPAPRPEQAPPAGPADRPATEPAAPAAPAAPVEPAVDAARSEASRAQPRDPAAVAKPRTAPRRGIAPNFFAMRPGPALAAAPALREAALIRTFVAVAAAVVLLVVTTAVVLRFPAPPPGAEPVGALAGTDIPGGGLVLMLPGALLQHARSGLPRRVVTAGELGLGALSPPLWTHPGGDLLLNASTADDARPVLQRCSLADTRCTVFLDEAPAAPIIALAASTLGDTLYLLDGEGTVLRASADGNIQGSASLGLPWGQPRLLVNDGLLLLPAADGPLIGVYRTDRQQFGAQLDALLLLPADAAPGRDRIQDLALTQDVHWALLGSEDGDAGLYRFDRQWNALDAPEPAEDLQPRFLVRWRDKILLGSPESLPMARYASDGRREAPLESEMLASFRDDWLRTSQLRQLLRVAGVTLPLLFAGFCLLLGAGFFLWQYFLPDLAGKRTGLLDPLPAGVHWLPAAGSRAAQQLRVSALLLLAAALPMAVLLLASSATRALAMLPAVLAALYASFAIRRGAGGHIGLLPGRLIAVDHDGRYYYGEYSALRGNRHVLLTPCVAVLLGFPWLRNIDARPDPTGEVPALPDTHVSTGEALALLWAFRHPWLLAALALATGWLLSLALLFTLTP